jgi:transcriptional regulator with XRE-family HTH domain
MTSEPSTPKQNSPQPDAVIDGVDVEFKVMRGPLPNLEGQIVRRVVRQGSKAQWYCTADPNDQRVKKFAEKLLEIRKAHHWSQTEAAKECGMTQPQWSSLETGAIEPLPKKIFEIERACGMDPGDFSTLLGYAPRGGDDRELFTQVAEKLDYMLVIGNWAVEAVLEFDSNATDLQKFLEDAEKVGIDVIAALAKLSNELLTTLNQAVDEAMPKVFRMKQAEMKNLSARLISLGDLPNGTRVTEPSIDDDEPPF